MAAAGTNSPTKPVPYKAPINTEGTAKVAPARWPAALCGTGAISCAILCATVGGIDCYTFG